MMKINCLVNGNVEQVNTLRNKALKYQYEQALDIFLQRINLTEEEKQQIVVLMYKEGNVIRFRIKNEKRAQIAC